MSPVETLRELRLTMAATNTLSRLMSAAQSVFGRSHARHKLTGFISHTTMYFLALAYTAALCINLFGCVFYFTARVEGIANGNTWLSAVGAFDMSTLRFKTRPVSPSAMMRTAFSRQSLHCSGGCDPTHHLPGISTETCSCQPCR